MSLTQLTTSEILYYILIAFFTACISIAILNWYLSMDDISNFTSLQDGKVYGIRDIADLENKKKAVNQLSSISKKIDYLTEYMYKNGLPNQQTATRLLNRWVSCKLRETSSNDSSVAFTVNKGTEMRLCIRKNDNQFEDENTSMFVVLHELAHIMSISYGHNQEFRDNFKYLVNLASSLNLYKPQDFSRDPQSYCNTVINTTPCSDGSCIGTLSPDAYPSGE